jgi:hypothetical protein
MDGQTCKRDLKVFLQRLKRKNSELRGADHTYSAFWFCEFQARGAVHYHIFTTGRFNKDWLAQAWFEIVGSEDERHLKAGTRIESVRSGKHGIAAYASKYAAKQSQKIIPEGFGWVGRFWGVSGWRATVSADSWLEPDDLGTGAVVRHVKRLEQLIYSYKAKGKCTITPHDAGTFVVYMKSVMMMHEVQVLIDHIENAVRLYRPSMTGSMFHEMIGKGVVNDFEVLQQA